jgi:group I intron endonuclease
MEKICGIYKITSPTGKIYIGQSANIKKRISYYKRLSCKSQIMLYNSIKKYGMDAHDFTILKICKKDELNKFEIFFIKEYNSFNSCIGMNLQSGGHNYSFSEITKLKMSQSQIGNKKRLGFKVSDETRKKMSDCKIGRFVSDETRLKMSIANKGKVSNRKGVKLSQETINKIIESKKVKKQQKLWENQCMAQYV